jgi:hypothetical protein
LGGSPSERRAKLSFRALPGETFEGRVTFILHELETATRTAKARIEIGNPEHRIKHEMFAMWRFTLARVRRSGWCRRRLR